MLPIYYFFGQPIFIWLGILLAILVLVQMSIAKKIIRLNFDLWHRKIIPILIIIVLIFHAWYGLEIYWFHK